MRRSFLIAGMLLLLGTFFTTAQVANYNVIPMPLSIEQGNEKAFVLTKNTKILYPKNNEKMKRNAAFLTDYLKENTGILLKSKAAKSGGNAILLKTGLMSKNSEAYEIEVSPKGIVITGASEAGVFYGIQTLRKSIPVAHTKKVKMPAVKISDAPAFAYRGMMLDVARHFCTVDSVKRWIDMLALHNVNTFHWHLTEDQGWRIEIKKYPRLTEIGSKRTETVIGRNSGKYDGKPHGGFYTQAEAREIVAYAAERYINVVPEIDMPGHMLGALASYPELGCTGGPYQVWRQWGVSDDVLCMGNDKTFEFITDVLNEIMDIFPSKYIHIGGDECPKTNWKKCEKCQARIASLGLKADEHHSAEERLQSYFISYAEKVVNKKGRRMIGWDEILEGGLAPDATVMSWRGMSGGIAAAKMDHDVIMTPNSHLYFDHYQTKETKTEPLAIGGNSPVEKVYSFNPIPAGLNAAQRSRIIGVQANLWTEYVPNFRHAEYMVLPRMAALCEVQWSPSYKKDYENFLKRLPMLVEVYKLHNYNYAKHVLR
ncbi:MAG: beta-N-acetylhexosaminidase [Paludibacteraceae bacterium]|nr:beta-N-acetylhexosaminidase [Paludibacteraceae bacterium]